MQKISIAFAAVLLCLSSCTKDKTVEPVNPDINSNYPDNISVIINNKCSTTGCHNQQSKAAAGGLAMETWQALFEGGNGGAVVIPFRPDQSWFTYYINTDSSKGVILTPTMPYLLPPLTAFEWQTLYDWMGNGAPDKNGNIAFSGDPNRKKFYVSNQGCDLVSVFDASSKICMRCIDVGQDSGITNAPHQISVSPDGRFWYSVFANGSIIQKFNAADDSYVGSVKIGSGNWNTIAITGDGSHAFAVDWDELGKVAYVDLENLQFIRYYHGLALAYGSCVNSAGTTLYVTSLSGNYIYKLDVTDPAYPTIQEIVMNPPAAPNNIEYTFDPHEVILSPDESMYFVSCQADNSVRVFDATTDTLIKVIPVGQFPVDFAISLQRNLLFVTCEQEPCALSHCMGAVYVIDLNTLEVVKKLQENMYAPHAIGVMDAEDYAIVASRNTDAGGPSPHHVSDCDGRNGYVQLIDLNTLELIPGYRTEVSVDPYSLSVRE